MAKLTDKNTKTQILDAYYKLLSELEDQNAAKHDPAAEVKAKKTADTLKSAATTVGQSVEDQIAELQKSVQSVLVNLSGSFADKVKEYTTVEEAIAVKKAELKEVHDIEVQAFTLAALVNTQKELTDKHNNDFEVTQGKYNADLLEIKKQIADARETFAKELQEEKAKLNVERKREREEYEYNFNREKQKNEDELNDLLAERRKNFADQKAAEQKELDSTREELEKREEEVEAREEKIDELEAAVAALPEKESRIKAEAEASAKAQYDKMGAIKEASIKKHYESDAKVLQSQLDSANAQLDSEKATNAELAKKLDAAYEKIQTMAIATTQRPTVEYRSNQNESK